MPMWRCPHCGTPQAETARCWVCRRSSTACASCRNFRRSVAAQLGFCGLDRERVPLRGDEIRGCWEGTAAPIEVVARPRVASPAHLDDVALDRTPVRKLEFVEVATAAVTAAPGRGRKAPIGAAGDRRPGMAEGRSAVATGRGVETVDAVEAPPGVASVPEGSGTGSKDVEARLNAAGAGGEVGAGGAAGVGWSLWGDLLS